MRVIDAGHVYGLEWLDGPGEETLVFVKRNTPAKFYPGNSNAHAGTTTQQVLLALYERSSYVQKQFWAIENCIVSVCIAMAFWALEFRAARRHGITPHLNPFTVMKQDRCGHCGHIKCEKAK